MKLPSLIKGWLNPASSDLTQPENILASYIATNNSAYLNKLVAHFNQSLFHYLLSLSDKHLAEDVLQATWLKVMKSADKYQPGTSVKNWLFSIARNTLIDELRRINRWQWQDIDENTLEATNISPDRIFAAQESLNIFNQAVDALPFFQREAFIFQQEGFSLNEICELTNENFETVKSRIRYAKQSIKIKLELTHERG